MLTQFTFVKLSCEGKKKPKKKTLNMGRQMILVVSRILYKAVSLAGVQFARLSFPLSHTNLSHFRPLRSKEKDGTEFLWLGKVSTKRK